MMASFTTASRLTALGLFLFSVGVFLLTASGRETSIDGTVVHVRVVMLDEMVDAVSRGVARVFQDRILRVVLVQEALAELYQTYQ